jgi:hypothetical protein
LNLEKIKHGVKTLAACGGIRGVDSTSSLMKFWDLKITRNLFEKLFKHVGHCVKYHHVKRQAFFTVFLNQMKVE